jgi:adenylate cyclase
MERRLAAILAADVVGYSKMMSADEAGTLAALKTHRAEVFDPVTDRHNGRIVKLMGDGVLVEFASVVDAVECAIEVQTALSNANDSRIKLRIGINLGDVMIDGDDLYGDGVNVAARLEAIAQPGGICISSIVHESLRNRIEADFADAGEHQVKNIDRPIHVYRWLAKPSDRSSADARTPVADHLPSQARHKPTITVLPFENLSNDDELGFFCEGIAEDITTALGHVAQLTVVANKPSSAGQAGQQAARYVLEGSVRKSGARLRVSAQLIDSFSGVQTWAQRYDRDAQDMFEMQDDVTRNIVIDVHTALGAGAYTNRWQQGTNNFEAWQLAATAFNEFQKFSPDSFAKCAAMWEAALAIDPDFLSPRMAAGYCYAQMALTTDAKTSEAYIARAEAAVEFGLAVAPHDTRSYAPRRGIEVAKGNHAGAIAVTREEIDISNEPGSAGLAMALMAAGEPDQALVQINKTIQQIPNYPGWYAMIKIQCHYMMDELDEALREAEGILARAPEFYPGPVLAAALYAELGRPDDARNMSEKVRRMDPQFSIDTFVKSQGLKSVKHRERLFAALSSAGLPE